MDYEQRLERALGAVDAVGDAESRLTVPDVSVQPDGAFTRLENLGAVADALSRDPEHLHRYLQRDLGTNGEMSEGRARYNGRFSAVDFEGAIAGYIEEFVTCTECGLPDTRLATEGRTRMLRCEACGAFRPVAKRRRTATDRDRPAVEERETYRVEITGTGRKGDGVAEKGKYTIFVSGASEGQVVDVYIERVTGTLAFGRVA